MQQCGILMDIPQNTAFYITLVTAVLEKHRKQGRRYSQSKEIIQNTCQLKYFEILIN